MTYDSTYTFRVEGMHCASCGLLIDDTLADLVGVRGSNTSVRSGVCSVDVHPERCAPTDVVSAIEELGYSAQLAEKVPK